MSSEITRKFEDYSAEEIREAFLSIHGGDRPTEQIMSICNSLFDLIDANEKDLPEHITGPAWHLQQSFRVYMALVVKFPDRVILMSSKVNDLSIREDSLNGIEPINNSD